MRILLSTIGPALVLPAVLFVMLAYPAVELLVGNRLPLLTAYYLSRQLALQIRSVESKDHENPKNYEEILREYACLREHEELMKLKALSGSPVKLFFCQELLAELILRRERLPSDLLAADPIDDIEKQLHELRSKQKLTDAQIAGIVEKHVLECLRYRPPDPPAAPRRREGLPPPVKTNGLVFCGERIPTLREDVRQRIEYQIDYLLTDLLDTTYVWLKRKDRYGTVIRSILTNEGLPEEFRLLPALESGYNGSVISPSQAAGWWQFVKPTALSSRGREEEMDWALQVNPWRDDRKDLALSTRSAARYLKWIRARLAGDNGPVSWLMAAAAYNAGLSKVRYRMAAYDSSCFWDVKMPKETEDYVPRWVALSIIDANRGFYGIKIDDVDSIDFDTLDGITLIKDLPVGLPAAVTGCSERFMREINPALQPGERCFRAKGNGGTLVHAIHIPKGCTDSVLKFLKAEAYCSPANVR
ncbi:MAG: lytic transglycosylase domain-containing protein [Pseudomonadota bacterium]